MAAIFRVSTAVADPWGPHEVLARLRPHFELQNEIHIISSVVIDAATLKHRLGPSRNLIIGQHKPINSGCFLNDTHQYLFPGRRRLYKLTRRAIRHSENTILANIVKEAEACCHKHWVDAL